MSDKKVEELNNRLIKIREQLNVWNEKINDSKARLALLYEELKEQGFETIEKAEEELKKINKKIEINENKIEKQLEELENEFEQFEQQINQT